MADNFIHTEATFESAIIEHLCNNGWQQGNANDFNAAFTFDVKAILLLPLPYCKVTLFKFQYKKGAVYLLGSGSLN